MPGTISMVQTPQDGDEITASLWINEFQNIITNGLDPTGIGGASANASAMQATTDPYPANTESLPTDLAGEIKRLRFQFLELIKRFGAGISETKWYANIPYVFGTVGTDIASASALNLPSDGGNYFTVTGTTSITSITDFGTGSRITLKFSSALTLTHHSTNLILPGGQNILTAVGDVADFVQYGSGTWRCVSYTSMEVLEPSVAALTITDGSGNAATSVTTSWAKQYKGNRYHNIKVSGVFLANGSASGTSMRLSGFNLTMNSSGTPYVLGGFITRTTTGQASILATPTMISTSVVNFIVPAWTAGVAYHFTLDILVPV